MWLCAAGPRAASGGTLHGVVMDFTGAAIPNASIRIEHWELGTGIPPILKEDSLVTTGQDGSYAVGLNPGLYDVFVSFSTFSPVAKKVRVEAGKPSEYSPKLQLDPLTKFAPVDLRSGPPIPNGQ
jgi:hypothetical protein